MTVLHVSADFPDPLVAAKTRAVTTLIALTPEIGHSVYSLNRVSWTAGVESLVFGEDWRALTYGAPPRGVMLMRGLNAVADFIIEDAQRRNLNPAFVHGHKISVEGPIVERVADALGVPFLLSSMGDTDLKIMGFKKGLRPMWRRIWNRAAGVIAHAPWARDAVEAMLGPRDGPVAIVPMPTTQDAILPPKLVGPLIRSVFHLASWRRKNALGLIAAAQRARRVAPDLRLEIAGGGDPAGFARIAAAARRGGARLIGPMPHSEMGAFLNGSGGFALPSHRETYGMVFVEALLSGVPALHAAGNAIDGLLAPDAATLTAPSTDVDAIAEGLVRLAREEADMKARLATLQASGGLDHLRCAAVADGYRAIIAAARTTSTP